MFIVKTNVDYSDIYWIFLGFKYLFNICACGKTESWLNIEKNRSREVSSFALPIF